MTQAPPEPQVRTALEIAAAGRATQVAIRARLLRDVTTLWPMLDPKRLDETWPGWIRAMSLLVQNYHGQSAVAASATYRAAREQATHSPAPRSLIRLAPNVPQEWLNRAFGYSGPGQFQRDVARPNTALSTTLGTASRIVLDGGRTTIDGTIRVDPVAVGWFFQTDGDPCFWCALIASRGIVFEKDSFKLSNTRFIGDGTAKVHNNCVLPGTLTTGPAVETGYRRRYEGEVITLITASGNELSITPKHPVLTDRGWALASMLNEGDHLVGAIGADGALGDGPDVDHVPTRIEDRVRALSMDGSASLLRVPVTAEQFHGDGFASEVDVVTLNDLLGDVVDASFLEPEAQLDFHRRTAPSAFGGAASSGLCEQQPRGGRFRCATHGVVGGSGLSGALLGGEPTVHQYPSLAGGSDWQVALLEPPSHDRSSYPVPAGEGEDAFSVSVVLDEVLRDRSRTRVGVPRKYDPPPFDRGPQTLRVFTELGSDLCERLAGSVQLDRLVDKRSWQYHGDVLNLETVEGWYNANGITVSNCACTLSPAFSRDHALPDVNKEAAEVYRNRGDGPALKAFRKAWESRRNA